MVVTGTRTPSPRDFLGSSISVITSEEIHARKAITLGDVLRSVPGITIAQNGGPGSVSSIFIRGGESDYTKVLLDGIPLNKPGGAIDLSNISLSNVDRIEVVRGPQSALYGSDAISGVIQIFSRIETEEKKKSVSIFSWKEGLLTLFTPEHLLLVDLQSFPTTCPSGISAQITWHPMTSFEITVYLLYSILRPAITLL